MLTMVNQHEPELGVQRFCTGCREWWPLDDEFWVVWLDGRYSHVCRACFTPMARRRREKALRRQALGLPPGTNTFRCGHPATVENTFHRTDHGGKRCRECVNEAQRRCRRRRKARLAASEGTSEG